MSPILEIKNLTSELKRNGDPLLNSISFSLNSKDRLILRGPSGSGKSLLLRSLIFLDPITQGEVWFQAKKIIPEEVPVFRSRVLYLAQKSSLLEETVEDNLKNGFQYKIHQHKKYNRNWVVQKLKIFGFEESFLNQTAKHLSGGESQVVALIRGWILDSQIMILDEPTASLDKNRSEIFETELINWVESSQDRAFIWVTHKKEQESKVGKSFLNLSNGILS